MKNNLKRWTAIMMAVTLAVGCLPGNMQRKLGAQPEVKAEESINDSRIVADSSMDAGQKVTWDCVWFGAYPQTEIVDKAETSGCYGKDWGTSSDYEVNAFLYSTLQNASGWNSNGDITLNGAKYRRIKKTDVTYATSGFSGYYNWDESDTYHYFRYDPIKWRVLDTDGSTALLLADTVLDEQKYNTKIGEVTWETSTMRSWLNGYEAASNKQSIDYSSKNFVDAAFTSAQQGGILTSTLINADNINNETYGGNNTNDKVFLLSESEVYTDAAKSYGFVSEQDTVDESRRCKSTTYAKAMGIYSCDQEAYRSNCDWWLRSPGLNTSYAEFVYDAGIVSHDGEIVSNIYGNGVRPALRLNLSSTDLYSYAGKVCSDGTDTEVGGGSGSGGEEEDGYVKARSFTDVTGTINGTGKIWFNFDENEFSKSSMVYNHKMGKAASALAAMAYAKNRDLKKVLVEDLGFRDYVTHDSEFGDKSGLYSPFATCHKKILLDGDRTEILMVVVRGTYKKEWLDNFDPGEGMIHEGFKRAADLILEEMNSYIKKTPGFDKNAKLKVLMTGHSRGGAVTNLVGKEIDIGNLDFDDYTARDVFVYSFATPNNTSDANRSAYKYNNLYSIVNPEDFVTKVLPSDWGYGRYGRTFVLPSKTTERTGKSNYVDYEAYRANLRGWFNSAFPDEEYIPYPDGMHTISNYVDKVTSTVKNIKEYYNKDMLLKVLDSSDLLDSHTLHDLYKYALGGNRSGDSTYKALSYTTIVNALTGTYGTLGIKTINYFIKNQVWEPKFACAHFGETYYAAMKSLTEDQLIQKRKTLKGIVNCPVDVTISDEDGRIVGKILHNEVDQNIDNGVTMTVDGDSKVFYLPASDKFTVTLEGNDSGSMDYSLCEIDPDTGETGRVLYQDVPISNGAMMKEEIEADSELETLTLVDEDNDPVDNKEIYSSQDLGSLSIDVQVEGQGVADSLSNLTPGDYVTLQAIPDSNNTFIGWYDTKDNLISAEEEYAFSIKEDLQLTARFTNNIVDVAGIGFEKASISIDEGENVYNPVIITPENATFKDVAYETSDPDVATVDQMGIVQGVGRGKAVITATDSTGDHKATFTVKVGDPEEEKKEGSTQSAPASKTKAKIKVSKITLTGISKKIARGRKIKLTAAVLPKNAANKKLKWSSSNKKLATVTQTGLVKIAKKAKPGKTVKITAAATDGSGKKQVWAIKVMKGAVKKITVKGYKNTLKAGKTMKLKAVVKTTKGKPVNKKLKWSTSNKKYATVTQTGKVKAKPAGKGKTVKIKVMSTDGTNKSVVKKIKIK